MNSLQDLNGYSDIGIAFSDDRPFTITFSNAIPVNQTITMNEDGTASLPTGTDIIDLVSANNVVYTVNIASLAGTSLTWAANVPTSVNIATTGNGVYFVSNISSATVWDFVKSPTLSVPPDYTGSWSFDSKIGHSGNANVKYWNTAVTVTNVDNDYANMDLTRTYTENGVGLLFPTSVPAITDAGTTYNINFKLSDAIGIIGLGESFTSPVGWNATTNTYSYTGTRTQCNTVMSQLRFFPNKGISSNTTVQYKEYINGVNTRTTTFSLTGTALSSYITGGTGAQALDENIQTNNWGQFSIYPHYTDRYVVSFETGYWPAPTTLINNVAWFEPVGSNWIQEKTGGVGESYGAYKTFGAAASVTEYLANMAEISGFVLSLKLDLNSNDPIYGHFRLIQKFGLDSIHLPTWDITAGAANIVGGTVYTATKDITITPQTDKVTITTAYNYTEDAYGNIVATITDADVRSDITYTIFLEQLTPTNPGRFWVNNVASAWGSNVTITATKSALNTMKWIYQPPLDYTSEITLRRTQVKRKGVYSSNQADDTLTWTNTASNFEFKYPYTDTAYFGDIYNGATGTQLGFINSTSNTHIPAASMHAANISNPLGDNATFTANIGEYIPLSFRNPGTIVSPYTESARIFGLDDGPLYSANATIYGGNVSTSTAATLTGKTYTVQLTDLNNKPLTWHYNTSHQFVNGETYLTMPIKVFSGNSTTILGPATPLVMNNFLRDLTIKSSDFGLVKLQATVTRTTALGSTTLFSGNTCNIRVVPDVNQSTGGGIISGYKSYVGSSGYTYPRFVEYNTKGNVSSYINGHVAGGQDFYMVSGPINSGTYWCSFTTSSANFPGVQSYNDGMTNTANLAALGSTYTAAYYADNYSFGGYTDWYLPSEKEAIGLSYSDGSGANWFSSTLTSGPRRLLLGTGGLPTYINWDDGLIAAVYPGKTVPVRRIYIQY